MKKGDSLMHKAVSVLRRFLRGARDLLFPPYCVVCGDLFLPFGAETFCPACREAWADARTVAAEAAAEAAAVGHAYLVHYRSGKTDGVPERFVFHIKHKGDARAFSYAAKALSMGVRVAILSADVPEEMPEGLPLKERSPIFTYTPRRRAAVHEDGFDQAARLARALAREMGGEFLPLLRRGVRRKASEQKRLGTRERIQNAKASYALRRRADARVRGRTVVLCDDLATTGATLERCEKLLLRAGASAVVWATVAQTEGIGVGSLRVARDRERME